MPFPRSGSGMGHPHFFGEGSTVLMSERLFIVCGSESGYSILTEDRYTEYCLMMYSSKASLLIFLCPPIQSTKEQFSALVSS